MTEEDRLAYAALLVEQAPPLLYESWSDYLAKTSEAERMRWCAKKAIRANTRNRRLHPMYEAVAITNKDVWTALEAARGRCVYCGSLALERKPVRGRWEAMGRRIGSLEHMGSGRSVIAWCCLLCNSQPRFRPKGDYSKIAYVHKGGPGHRDLIRDGRPLPLGYYVVPNPLYEWMARTKTK